MEPQQNRPHKEAPHLVLCTATSTCPQQLLLWSHGEQSRRHTSPRKGDVEAHGDNSCQGHGQEGAERAPGAGPQTPAAPTRPRALSGRQCFLGATTQTSGQGKRPNCSAGKPSTEKTRRSLEGYLVIGGRLPSRTGEPGPPAYAQGSSRGKNFPCFSNTFWSTNHRLTTRHLPRLATAQKTKSSSKLKESMALNLTTEQAMRQAPREWQSRSPSGTRLHRNPRTTRTSKEAKMHSEAKEVFIKSTHKSSHTSL